MNRHTPNKINEKDIMNLIYKYRYLIYNIK